MATDENGFRNESRVYFVLFNYSLVVYLGGDEVTASFDILRDKHDTFQNRECQKSKNCTKEQCETYGANCADDKCKRCQCKDGKNTFLTHTGNCTADEMVVPESGEK